MNCLNCGGAFEQNRHWQKFCSEECRHEFNNNPKLDLEAGVAVLQMHAGLTHPMSNLDVVREILLAVGIPQNRLKQ